MRSEQREEGLFVIHEVEEKETLFSLSKRYNSSIDAILKFNQLTDNSIDIGQVLSILVVQEEKVDSVVVSASNEHVVAKGETLYSIARQYELSINDIKEWNGLTSNDLSLGQVLKIGQGDSTVVESVPAVEQAEVVKEEPKDSVETYIVQMGQTLHSIAKEIGISIDSLKDWNNLSSDYLRIGQTLSIRSIEVDSASMDSTVVASQLDADGFEKEFEVGTAALICEIKTKKFLALHRTLPIGTELEVRNLMNNLVVHVKVVGKLPNTGINRNVLLRLSRPAFEQLRILDPRSRVEVSHYIE